MRPLDRLTSALRRAVEYALPWYDPKEAERRRQERKTIRAETERVRQRSIAARIHVEDIAERYRRQDGVLRR